MFGKEPAIVLNGLGEVIRAIVPCLILFGFIEWTDDQIAAVFLVVSVILGFFTTILTRSSVTPTETSDKLIRTAVGMPSSSTVDEVKDKANV